MERRGMALNFLTFASVFNITPLTEWGYWQGDGSDGQTRHFYPHALSLNWFQYFAAYLLTLLAATSSAGNDITELDQLLLYSISLIYLRLQLSPTICTINAVAYRNMITGLELLGSSPRRTRWHSIALAPLKATLTSGISTSKAMVTIWASLAFKAEVTGALLPQPLMGNTLPHLLLRC